ncbi:Transmembrane BAX inhibitor motif-containing protein 4 [Rhizophlyctis rosea]|nr:Transmembrane BAX inhibitor motif-containing protein 4 [Rhizophlyctis rosea]
MPPPKHTPLPTEDPDSIAVNVPATNYGAVGGSSSAATAPPRYEDDVPDDFKYGVTLENSDVAIRMAFTRKVYSILAVQLGLTTLVSGVFLYNDAIKAWAQSNMWMVFLSWLATLGLLIALIVNRRKHPVNLYLLAAFTVSEAYTIGTVVTFHDSEVVLQAAILSFALFIGLTLFTVQTKYDFTSWGPFLFGSLWVIIIAGFVQLFLPFSRTLHLFIAIGTAIVFCGFVVFDTQQIFTRLSPEEYILAAIEVPTLSLLQQSQLYLDVINLFLHKNYRKNNSHTQLVYLTEHPSYSGFARLIVLTLVEREVKVVVFSGEEEC